MNESSDGCVDQEDVHRLLEHFSKNTHKVRAGDMKGETVNETCLLLFAKDYRYSIIPNFSGELCAHYPGKIILPEYEYRKDQPNPRDDKMESIHDLGKLKELFKQARFARCRSRFVVPVIQYEGKLICRSGTLSSGAEMYGRSGFDFFFSGAESFPDINGEEPDDQGGSQLFDRFRGQDKKLLKSLDVGYICDLMVEKKKVKFGMNITSSEKVDKENRYSEFCILSAPYPGCEFFKEWKEKSTSGQTIWYDWSQGFNDAALDIPTTPLLSQLPYDWTKYRHWDLVQLTQNYLKLLLHIVTEGDSGLLVHCISGWDRTPLFISLLRLSLWADGAVHKSLSPLQMLYLTLGYDWYLFGHNLSDRLSKGEEILYFCFNFLHYMTSEEFSSKKHQQTSSRHRPSEVTAEARRTCRVDSESIIPIGGVLLGPEPCRPSPRGSNTSMSSVGSSETGPVFFTVGSHEEESVVIHDNPLYNGIPSQVRPSLGYRDGHSSDSSLSRASPQPTSSSPMAVPSRCRHADGNRSSSPGLGSWQIISSAGSLRGGQDSPHVSSGKSSTSSHVSLSSCHEALEPSDQTARFRRLDSVWRMFHNAYSNSCLPRPSGEASTGAISSLLEKVGIRSGRNNTVV